MKKIILLIIVLLPINVFALDNVDTRFEGYFICDESNKKYPINYANYEGNQLIQRNYSYAGRNYINYVQIDNDDSKNFAWIEYLINKDEYKSNFYEYIAMYTWEKLYPDKRFYFCSNINDDEKEEEYLNIKQLVDNILNGPSLFNNKIYQVNNELKTYNIDYLDYYELTNKNDLNLDIDVSNNNLSINGKSGEYKLVFKIKGNHTFENKTFLDGNNYLVMGKKVPDNKYIMDLTITPFILKIKLDNISDDLNYKLVDKDNNILKEEKLDSDKEIKLDKGYYKIIVYGDLIEDYIYNINLTNDEEIIITKNLFKEKVKEINVIEKEIDNENDIIVLNEEESNDVISFIAKDTFKNK